MSVDHDDAIESAAIDIGDDHTMTFSYYEGQPAGVRVSHKTPGGDDCVGWVAFAEYPWARSFDPHPVVAWTVERLDPLTLSPSILCRACGDHGFIRNSRWVRA